MEIEGGEDLSSGQPVAISGRRMRLQVTSGSAAAFIPDGTTGSLAVTDLQIFLLDAFPPQGSDWRVLTLNGISGGLQTAACNVVLRSADKSDPATSESAVISTVNVAGPVTTLGFDGPLNCIYDRATVTVNTNTVAATHGETMHEILGNGDGTNSALQFALKQSPLTHVSAASSAGSQSTLQVWVNNLQWHEEDDFIGTEPADRIFITRMDEKQVVTVQFGDGNSEAPHSFGATERARGVSQRNREPWHGAGRPTLAAARSSARTQRAPPIRMQPPVAPIRIRRPIRASALRCMCSRWTASFPSRII